MAASRSKTNLACDVCRRRKSRCDGLRPACSHCKASGQECIYRPTPTSLDTDTSVLSRLDDVERRLGTLEERPRGPTFGPREIGQLCGVPRIHTAAAHKLLHTWPRLRLLLSVQDINPLTYLRDSDEADPVLLSAPNSKTPRNLPYQVAAASLERFYDYAHELPIVLVFALANSPMLSKDRVAGGLVKQHGHPNQMGALMTELDRLSYEQLLILSMALSIEAADDSNQGDDRVRLSELCLVMCMQQQWQLLSRSDDECVSLTLVLSIYLVHFWDRPFQAISFLHATLPPLVRLIMRHDHDEASILQTRAYVSIHYIMKCDILTEIDGATPHKYHGTYQPNFVAASSSSSPSSSLRNEELNLMAYYLDCHVQLRDILNRILHGLYSLEKAFAHPHELAHLVEKFAEELDRWYRSLPQECRFHREVSTFNMRTRALPRNQLELSLRYHACVFLLHRPVLYFFLHKDMEYSVKPPPPPHQHTHPQSQSPSTVRSSSPSTPNAGFSSSYPTNDSNNNNHDSPWVFDSCRSCIDAAALIILTHRMRLDCRPSPSATAAAAAYKTTTPGSHLPWTESQMLFAAHLMLVQVRAVPSLCGVLSGGQQQLQREGRGGGAAVVDDLMDTAEGIFEEMLRVGDGEEESGRSVSLKYGSSLKLKNALVLLRGERKGFENLVGGGGPSPRSFQTVLEKSSGGGGGRDTMMMMTMGGHGT